ncbi:Uncharacterized protein BM_BM8933 [Brugia malayi]|uniref:Uncharacterized protein n=1 Tax=Brugia malayi TaxID=6279 RepID=A0A4E9FH55_BRUMA|nr:Uncharacterized protein BM_BM8933 [Brugia malayi]VIO92531.1 Uncharacterized protein BM_BM8933 [Brugia malayi]
MILYYLISTFLGCCVSSTSLLWMIITLFIFFIIFAILGLLAIWLLCAYYRRKSRKRMEKELQHRREDKNQLKLDMFRKKQLDIQMMTAIRDTKIGSKEHPSFRSRELMNSQMSFMPYAQLQKPEQYPSHLPPQSIPSTLQTTAIDKTAKEIEDLQLLPASTAKTPSQKTEKDKQLSTEKDSQATGESEVKVKDDEKPQFQEHETDVSNENQLDKWKRKKYKKRKSKTEKRKTGKSDDQKYRQTTSTQKPERYHHQIQPDHVHEWISRVARSTSPVPYFSPNKRVLLIPELSAENLDDTNDEESDTENKSSLDETGTNISEKLSNSLSHPNTMMETDVEISTETNEESTPMTPTPISASVNAPPSSTFLDDQSYWKRENKQRKYLKTGNESKIINDGDNISKNPTEKILWKPPDKRAEARFNRTLENPWFNTVPTVHSTVSYNREE